MADTPPEIDYKYFPHAKGHEKDVVQVDGELRYRKNVVIRWLLDFGDVDINKIWTTHNAGAFTTEDMMEFYRLIGYSLNGFEEIWHSRSPLTADEDDDEDDE